jgi:hypothetical protein
MHSQNTVFCNYFAARPRFWRRWLEVGEILFELAQDQDTDLGRRLAMPTSYRNHHNHAFKVFIQERIASLLLATEAWNFVSFNMFELPGLFKVFAPARRELLACDALKIAYARTGHEDYLQEYARLRGTVQAICSLR